MLPPLKIHSLENSLRFFLQRAWISISQDLQTSVRSPRGEILEIRLQVAQFYKMSQIAPKTPLPPLPHPFSRWYVVMEIKLLTGPNAV